MTTVILVRHGQTEWNRSERFRGRYDVPPNETGLAQADAAARAIAARWRIAAVYASPLSRAMDTARAIARVAAVVPQAHSGLIDIDYGAWQGLTLQEIRAGWPQVIEALYRGAPDVAIPGGEPLLGVGERALSALRDLAARHAGQVIVAVSHTTVNRALLVCAMGLPWDRFWHLGQENGAINVLELREDRITLVQWNDTCHLIESVTESALSHC